MATVDTPQSDERLASKGESTSDTKPAHDAQTGPTVEAPSNAPSNDLERATSWLEHGQASRALRTLRRLGNESPEDATILSVWQQAAEQTKAWGEARSVAEQRARTEHSEDSLLSLARLQRMTGQTERAKNTLLRLAREFPECEQAKAQLTKLDSKPRVASR